MNIYSGIILLGFNIDTKFSSILAKMDMPQIFGKIWLPYSGATSGSSNIYTHNNITVYVINWSLRLNSSGNADGG